MFSVKLRDGIALRLIEETDADEIFAVVEHERDHLREWLLWADTATPESNRAYIEEALERFARNDGLHAGIWSGGRFAGGAGCHQIDWVNQKVEIGYWLAREFQGQGIMTAACRVIIGHAFGIWKLNRVEIRCAAGNERSNKVARRLGFTLDGVLREGQYLYGKYHDLNIYGMLAREWPNRL